ncbi:MAG: redoxin domain-containing protein [Verrucomicrobia subdivision 3 bacterium]|nr:redoxin domain-containing protein [Limisphaerales bacterium]
MAIDAVRHFLSDAASDMFQIDRLPETGDLQLLHEDTEFKTLIGTARARFGAKSRTGVSERSEHDDGQENKAKVEVRKFLRDYWNGDRKRFSQAEWIAEFRSQIDRYQGTTVIAELQHSLLVIYSNEKMWQEFLALYLELLNTSPNQSVVGDHAQRVLEVSKKLAREDEVLGAFRKLLEAAEPPKSVPAIFFALAERAYSGGETEKAKAHYRELLRRFPDDWWAARARGRLHEIEHLNIGQMAPRFETAGVHGQRISLQEMHGKVVLLHFWATWCGPCKPDLPMLRELHAALPVKNFALVSVSLDEDGLALVTFLDKQNVRWPQVCDLKGPKSDLAQKYNVSGIPETYLIDREGKIAYKGLRGEKLKARIIEMLATK